jgi:hypothetical protein
MVEPAAFGAGSLFKPKFRDTGCDQIFAKLQIDLLNNAFGRGHADLQKIGFRPDRRAPHARFLLARMKKENQRWRRKS